MPTPTFFGQNQVVVDGGSPVPSTIADMWEWWEPSRESLSDDDPIPTLHGQLNGRDCTQATSSQRPIYKINILNGLACSRHEGWNAVTPYWWLGPDMSSLTAAHVFIVVKFDFNCPGDTENTGGWRFGTSLDADHHPWSDCNWYDGSFSNVRKSTGNPSPDTSQWRLVEIISTSSEWTIKFDGTTHFTTATNTVACNASPRIGRNVGNDALKGYFAGIYLCSAKITTDRVTLVDYINDRFAQSFG